MCGAGCDTRALCCLLDLEQRCSTVKKAFATNVATGASFVATFFGNLYNCQNYEIQEIELVATFKLPVATCGEWRQGWTPPF